jgi:isopentenyl-diphosphate delta-isomerase
MVAAAGDEPVEIVDRDGRVLRVVPRRQMRAERLRHRTVFVAVLSSDGRLLVHQRSADKDVWPGWWDVAVGGVVAVGESWDQAAARELAEEVGVVGAAPEPIDGGRLGRFEDDDVRLVGRCYRVVHDGPFSFADGEVVQARFVTPAELAELRRRERFLPDSVALVLPLLDGFGPHTR